MAYYERDQKGELVPTTEQIPDEAIRLMERYDDEAIIRRMTTGIASKEFIYRFPIQIAGGGTKEVIGIGSDGAFEIAKMLGNVEVLPDAKVDKESDPDYIYGMVRVKDLIRNVVFLGVGKACKFQMGKGNIPDHDRINEHAFVSCISKAQRNGILHQTSEEIIARIINAFEKSGRVGQLTPPKLQTEPEPTRAAPAPKPAPAPAVVTTPPPAVAAGITPEMVAQQQERLKNLRMQVHNKFQTDLGISVDKRKQMLDERFSVSSLTDLNEQQLRECLSWIEDMIQQGTAASPGKPAVVETKTKDMGFENAMEQNKLRGTLFTTLTAPGMLALSNEEAKQFIVDRGYTSTVEISKRDLLELIKEADGLVKAGQIPTEF